MTKGPKVRNLNRSPILDVEVNILLEHRVDCRLDEAIPLRNMHLRLIVQDRLDDFNVAGVSKAERYGSHDQPQAVGNSVVENGHEPSFELGFSTL